MNVVRCLFNVLLVFLAVSRIDCGWCDPAVGGAEGTIRSFEIKGDSFYKDGQPFRFISCEMHYWRSVHQDWTSRLRVIHSSGCNCLTVYVYWALHEPKEGCFDFSSESINFVKFITLAAEEGLLVFLRVGPYICAEVDFGGFPAWLTTKSGIGLRTPDPIYLGAVDAYFDELVPLLIPLQYEKGGPVVSVQIEDDTDVEGYIDPNQTHAYYSHLRAGLQSRGLTDVLISTLSEPITNQLSTALTEGCWLGLEFGPGTNLTEAFETWRAVYPSGPPAVMEFYSGWFDCVGDPHNTMDVQFFCQQLEYLLSFQSTDLGVANVSVSIYMGHGGSNFEFLNGAFAGSESSYCQVTTSYDYDGPVNEAGDATDKLRSMREVIIKYLDWSSPPLPPIPQPSPKGSYGTVYFSESALLFDLLSPEKNWSGPVVRTKFPVTMESLGQNFGYVYYSTLLNFLSEERQLGLEIQDRALLFLNGSFFGKTGWAEANPSQNLTIGPISTPTTLGILVEGRGRCSGAIHDLSCARKGILQNVTLGSILLSDWLSCSLPMTLSDLASIEWKSFVPTEKNTPTFYKGIMEISANYSLATYLSLENWNEGFIAVGGCNLGRISSRGPQGSIFVPASCLQPGKNEVIVFESDTADSQPSQKSMRSIESPIWN